MHTPEQACDTEGTSMGARAVLATVPGAAGPASIDACLPGFDRVLDPGTVVGPADAVEEVLPECSRPGIDLAVAASAAPPDADRQG